MKSPRKRALALILAAILLLSNVNFLPTVSAAALFYGDYTDAAKIYDSYSCPSMQGLAVGSQYLYAIKTGLSDSRAVITRTDKDTGSTVTLTDASTGYSYFSGLDHANDMAVWGIDSKSHLFVGTTLQGANAIIRYRVNGTKLEKVASYHLTCNGEDICATAFDVMKVDSSGYIHLITKWGQTVYTGTVHKDAGSKPTVAMTELCTISKEIAYIRGEKLDLRDWVNQGFGYYDNTLFVPLSGPDDQLHRSVVLVYDLSNVQQGSIIYPTDSVAFRVTSGAYSALFEIESVDVCSSDKKLYFNTNRRVTNNDTNYDGISSFDGYTYSKPAAASFDNVHHFHAKFLPNGGTGTMDIQRIVYNVSTPLSANAYTRTGYTFAGWAAHRTAQDQWYYTNGTDDGWYAKDSQPAGYTDYVIYRDQQKVAKTSGIYDDTVEFVAQWKPIDYTVTWTIDGQVYKTTTAHYGDKLTAPSYTVPSGYTFSGWSVPTTMPAQNLIINATLSGKSSTVTWVVDGKTTTETYDYGATPSYKGSTAKASDGCTVYTFAGWSPSIAAVTGDVTYTATYTSKTEHAYQSVTTDATCTTPGYTTYTCSGCGDSYTEYEGALTEWSETKPTNIPEEQIETKQQYRYADKITTTSSSAALDGYTLESSTWSTTGTSGSLQYVKNWPSGFSTSHSLYSTYCKTPKASGETATTKTTVSSDTTTGYLYYHWCYNNSFYSVATKQGSYTTFHAYYSTTNPDNYICDTGDMSYETGHSTCANSDWWFVAEVNTQKYTTYGKVYTHSKWGDWSAWSDTKATASATRKVESRTLYRYMDTPLGTHSYEAVVTKPTCTTGGYTTYTCFACGDTYVADEVTSSGHAFVNGTCGTCGAADPNYKPFIEKFDIAFSQVDMGNALGMNFAFPAVEDIDFTGAYAVATMAGSTQKITADKWTTASIGGKTHYVFGYSNIAAKQMADEVSIVIYNADGEAISNEYVDSIQGYVMRNVDKKDAESKALMVDMLNYGAAAQVYYGYNDEDLANAQLSEAQKAYGTATSPTITDIRVKGANYLGTRLELGSSIIMQMGFQNLTADMYATVEFTNHSGVKVSERVAPTQSYGQYVIIIDQIVVADGRMPVTVTVYNADGTVYGSATDSMASYIARMSNADSLYGSIMKFSDSAYTYLH